MAEPGEVLSVSRICLFGERYTTSYDGVRTKPVQLSQARRNRYRCVLDQTERVVHRCVIAVSIAAIVQLL